MAASLNQIDNRGNRVIIDQRTGQPASNVPKQKGPDLAQIAPQVTQLAPETFGGVGAGGIAAGAAVGSQQIAGAMSLAEGKKPSAIQSAALFPITGGFDQIATKVPGFSHKGTKEYEAERWGGLSKIAPDNANFQERVRNLAIASHGPQADENRWNQIKDKAMKSAPDMWGTYGMLNTFGSDYFDKMNEFQRFAATQYAIDNGLLKGDKGDIVVTDPERLKAALKDFTDNKAYQDMYNAWKSGGEGMVGSAPEAKPKTPLGDLYNLPVGGMDLDRQLAAYNKELRDVQASAGAEARRQATLADIQSRLGSQQNTMYNPYNLDAVKNKYLEGVLDA